MRFSTNKRLGFNLTELLVVIGILALLAFAAAPRYRDYIIRAKVSKALFYLDELQDALIQQRTELIGAGSFTYGGTEYNHEGQFAVSPDDSVWAQYNYWGPSTYNGVEMICIYVNDLQGIESYQEFTTNGGVITDEGARTRVCTRVYSNDLIFNHDCGRFPDASLDIPLDYLPSGCQCDALTTQPLGSC